MFAKENRGWEKHIDFIFVDMLVCIASLLLAYTERHGLVAYGAIPRIYKQCILVLCIAHIFVAILRESYTGVIRRGTFYEIKECLIHWGCVDAILLVFMFLSKTADQYSRQTVIEYACFSVVLSFFVRYFLKKNLRKKQEKGVKTERILVLTEHGHADSVIQNVEDSSYRNYQIVGLSFLDEADSELAATEEMADLPDEIDVLPHYGDFNEYLRGHVVDSVFIDSSQPDEEVDQIRDTLIDAGLTVYTGLLREDVTQFNYDIKKIGKYVTLSYHRTNISYGQLILKRSLDIFGGLVGTIFTGVLCIFFGPLIYIQSPGPIFFKQQRVGRNGRTFKMYKFRSMCMDAEEKKQELMEANEMDGLMFKLEDDPRIIPIGRVIRKLSIDEFPQFINVLKGDMSLVGTRPPTVDEYEQYSLHHQGRLSMKPGITGLWQTSGRSDITDFEKVVRLDKQYIYSWSFRLDIKILIKTVIQVLLGKGAE